MKSYLERLKEGLGSWAKLSLLFLLFLLIIRVFFFLEVHYRIEVGWSSWWTVFSGASFDYYVACRIACWLLLPYLIFYSFFPKTTHHVYVGLIFLMAVISVLLTEYYCNLNMPLDHVILVYTPKELMGVASSSSHVEFTPFFWFFLTIGILVALALLLKKVVVPFWVSVAVMVLFLTTSCIVNLGKLVREEKYYGSHNDFCLASNQMLYTYVHLADYIKLNNSTEGLDAESGISDEVYMAATRYHAVHHDQNFLSNDYPFYRVFDDKDVLSPFLSKTSDGLPPNFVFIILESYGQRLTGIDHPVLSFTPFLDSLKNESLYWTNCLSSAERTFGALPAIFASVPYGRKGFSQNWEPMPSHNSLLKDLKANGYTSAYYYGGINEFDRYDTFLKENKVDYIYLPEISNIDSATYQYLSDNHRWGLDDKETFEAGIQRNRTEGIHRPFIDIFMSLTTHEPFYFQDVEKYEKRVADKVEHTPGVSGDERGKVLNNKNIFGCFWYMDDCVRELMEYYKTTPEYNNTIFIITGDHRMGPLFFGTPLHAYNVPLLIFSPLLQRAKTMEAVVTHNDITPSLNAYLSQNYNYQIDTCCHWMGSSFDTCAQFQNTRKMAFMRNNRDVIDYVSDNYFLNNKKLFKFNREMYAELCDNKMKYEQLKSELEDFNVISRFVVYNNYLQYSDLSKSVILSKGDYDFDVETRKEFAKHTVDLDGNACVLIDYKDEYPYFITPIVLDHNYQKLTIELSFDLMSADTTIDLPNLVMRLGQSYREFRLTSPFEQSLNTGNLEHFHVLTQIPIEGDCVDETVKVYLWNKKKGKMYFDNLKYTISAQTN